MGVSIDAKVENLEDAKVYLVDVLDSERILDSARMRSGKFHMRLKRVTPTFAMLKTENDFIATLLLCPGEQNTLTADVRNSSWFVTGSEMNNRANDWDVQEQLIFQDFRQARSPERRDQIEQHYKSSIDSLIAANRDNIFGAYTIISQGFELKASDYLRQIESMSPQMQSLPFIVAARERALRKSQLEPRSSEEQRAPIYINIELKDLDGKPLELKNVIQKRENRYVLVDFWATWCRPCVNEIATLRDAYEKYHRKGFEIYAVSLDNAERNLRDAISMNRMSWLHVTDFMGFNSQACVDYVVDAIPANYLIECSTGEIVAMNLRGEQLRQKLSELLK